MDDKRYPIHCTKYVGYIFGKRGQYFVVTRYIMVRTLFPVEYVRGYLFMVICLTRPFVFITILLSMQQIPIDKIEMVDSDLMVSHLPAVTMHTRCLLVYKTKHSLPCTSHPL